MKYYIGIDVGGTLSKIAVVNERGRIVAKRIVKTPISNKNALINKIVQASKEILSEKNLKRKHIKAVGVGMPGAINSEKGIVYYLPNIPRWKNVPLKKILESKLKIKTCIDNDVSLMTLGEFCYGAGKGAKNIVCITLGTGVGGGIILDGKLYRGATLVGGEIGHVPISVGGPKCNCGGWGCVESYIGNRYLMNRLRRELKKNRSIIKTLIKKKRMKLSLELVDRAAEMGDKYAVWFWKDFGIKLGTMLTGVVNLLNPERIIIGGGVAGAGKFIFGPVKQVIRKRAMPIQAKSVRIVKAKLGEDAGVIGAAVFARLNGK